MATTSDTKRYRVVYSRYASATLTVRARQEEEALNRARESFNDPRFQQDHATNLVHRYWNFAEEITRLHVVSKPAGEDGVWLVRGELDGLAFFRVEAASVEAATEAALQLLMENEQRFPVQSGFWNVEPKFFLVEVTRVDGEGGREEA